MRNEKGQYTKGHKETVEEKRKRINGMIDAWKKRSDYIDDIVTECPHIYNVWRGLMFTKKGKAQGISEEWKNFRTFYNDVRPSYESGFLFRRIDVELPYSIDNFIWVHPHFANCNKNNMVRIEYNGEFLTLRELADKYNPHCYNAIKIRYYKKEKYHYTTDEIVFGRVRKRFSKVCKDVPKDKEYTKAKKMIYSYKAKDKKMGLDVCDIDADWMVKNIFHKPCVYCGDNHRIGCDRIDNNLGHTKSNVVPCCIECNMARNSNFSMEEMFVIGAAIRKVKKARKKNTKQ